MSKQTGTSTTTTAPPRWARPAIQGALGDATGLYNQGLNSDQLAGMSAIRSQAGDPSFLSGAKDALTGMMSAGPNPHLDAMFGQAADRTRSQFASEFANAGRDIGAAAPFREMQLGDLATSIYGGAYDADQNRRLSAAGLVPGINAAGFQGGQALLGLGQIPGQQLDQYIGRIGGLVGNYGQTRTPEYSSPLGSALGLAFAGGWQPFGG